MLKEFDKWNSHKKDLEIKDGKIFFKEWEIWRTAIWLNIGSESCGKWETFRRPVLIIKKLSGTSCIAIPLTSKPKDGSWFSEITIHDEKSWALLYQIRMMSTNRFQRRLATLDDKDFFQVKEKLKYLLELP